MITVRKLEADESPHEVYIDNYSNGEFTRVAVKRWLFNTKLESQLCRDETALNFIFWEVPTKTPLYSSYWLF